MAAETNFFGQDVCGQAIRAVINADMAFCKFLSANDSGETGGHQSGILVSKSARPLMFSSDDLGHIEKRPVKISWQDGSVTESMFTWYESKGELRITRFGRGFEFLRPDKTGSLFVFTLDGEDAFSGFFLDAEEEIDCFLDFFGISPAETNALIDASAAVAKSVHEQGILEIAGILTGADRSHFPTTVEMSHAARELRSRFFKDCFLTTQNPDRQLLNWTEEEYSLFKAVEQAAYGDVIGHGFSSLDAFIGLANTVLNRRKSRAGKSLEHHLSALFDGNHLSYTPQARTEKKKTPDFIFPSVEAYHNASFPADKLISLAAKTTCKDRWRQVITEADRIPIHYLCTLQQGISAAQLDEMTSENVVLVVPKPYIKTYPKPYQEQIWTVGKFISFVQEKENA